MYGEIALLSGTANRPLAEAISRGVVTGTISDWNAMVTFRINDVARYHCLVPFGTTSLMLAMTKKKYESLPPKAKAILDKYKGEYFARYWAERLDAHMDEVRAKTGKDPKHSIYRPNAEEMKQWKTKRK